MKSFLWVFICNTFDILNLIFASSDISICPLKQLFQFKIFRKFTSSLCGWFNKNNGPFDGILKGIKQQVLHQHST